MLDMFRATSRRELRPHQAKAIEMLRHSFAPSGKGNRRVVLQAATGFGKTLTAAKIIESALAKNGKVLFTVPRLSLIDQTVSEFRREGIDDIGVIQANHMLTNPLARVQVASLQTLARRDVPQGFNLVICDECHEMHQIMLDLMQMWPDKHFVGLSATPWAKGMGRYWQDLVQSITIGELIEQGYLSKFVAYAPDVPDMSGVKTVAGEFHEGQAAEVMAGKAIMANVVETWLAKGGNRPTLLFAVNRAHAKQLQEAFIRAGVAAGYCDAHTDVIERQHLGNQIRSGEVKIACSVRTLTTGVDWPISCIIDAAPTRSEMLHVQKIGRGLRVNPGTEDCISADTLILTDKGLCEIRHITLDHKVWDGVSFVKHSGAVCRGVRPVITYDGITGTPDHRVMTQYGWRTLDEAASRRLRIARTGIGRIPVRFVADCISQGRGEIGQASRGSAMRSVLEDAHGIVSQYKETPEHEGLPKLQWSSARDGSEVALCKVPRPEGSLSEPEFNVIFSVWSARHRVQVCKCECCGDVGGRNAWCCEQINGARSDQQRWALRAGKLALGAPSAEYGKQHEVKGISGSVHWLPISAPRCQVFGSVARGYDQTWHDGRADCAKVGRLSGQQSEEEVWDILNAGPLQRFTANGRLVHNCLILDHAGNSFRLGLVTDIHHDTLDTSAKGEKAEAKPKAEKLPKECANCGTLQSGRVCSVCGHERKPQSGVDEVDGDLVQISGGKKNWTKDEKQAWWSGILTIRASRNRSMGWASNTYRDKFGVWPLGLDDKRGEATAEMWNFVKSKDIAFAKRQEKNRGR